jgi:pyrroline-5-carboxylate reductase
MITQRIGIVGAGKMGEALVSGLLNSKSTTVNKLKASDVRKQRREHVKKAYGISCYLDNSELVNESDVIILAIRPRDMKAVLEQIRDALTIKHLIISIAAGIRTDFISNKLPIGVQIIRAMPNNPAMVGEGMTVLAPMTNVSKKNLQIANEVFSSIGKVVVLEERHLDAVTGLSGSGPAYFFLIIEALAEAAVNEGIPRDVAVLLAAQTCLGSAKMVIETGEKPDELIKRIATPGGTTVQGLAELEKGEVKSSFIRAVEKATKRSRELSPR